MRKMLGRATAVAAGALMIVGLGATAASAHVAVGGVSGGVASADDPFVADWGSGFACAGDVHVRSHWADWATDEAAGGQRADLVRIGDHDMG